MYKLVSTKFKDTIFVTGGTGHSQTELLSLSKWSWESRAPCPLSQLSRMPSLFINGFFYVFGQTVESENVIASAVVRLDQQKNKWEELGGFGERLKRFAVVNTYYGVVIVDYEKAKPQLCQIHNTSVSCEHMKNNDLELTVPNEEVILFTLDHTQCPKSVIPPAMLFLETWHSRNELKIYFEEFLIFARGFIGNKE